MRRSPTTTSTQVLALVVLLVVAAQASSLALVAAVRAQTGPSVPVTNAELTIFYDPALVSGIARKRVPDKIASDLRAYANIYEHIDFAVSPKGDQGVSGVISLYRLMTDKPFTEIVKGDLEKLLRLAQQHPVLSGISPELLPEEPKPTSWEKSRALTVHAQFLNTDNDKVIGLRYLAGWIEILQPVNPAMITYVYQGITRDGKYWIDARFTDIRTHEGFPPPPNQETYTDPTEYVQVVADYYQNVGRIVARTPPNEFIPRLADIDAMIATLTTQDPQEQSVGGQIAFLEGADGSYEVEVYDLRTQTTTVIGSSIDTPYRFTGQLVGWSLEGAWLVVTNFGQTTTGGRYDLARVSPDGRWIEKLSFFNPGTVLAPLADGMMLETEPHVVVPSIVTYNALNEDVVGSYTSLGYAAAEGCLSEYMTAVGAPTHAIVVAVNCVTGPDPILAIQKLVGMQESGGTHVELGEMLLGQEFDEGACAGSPRGVYAPALSQSAKLAYVESDTCYSTDSATGPISVPGGSRILIEESTRALVESPQRIESISWSPDEQWIAYSVGNGLYAVQLATSAVVKLYTARNTIKDVHWNPAAQDGQVITPIVATKTPTAAPTRTPTATPPPKLTDIPVNAVTLDSKGDDMVLSSGETFHFWINVRNSGTLAWTKEHHGFRRTGQWAGQPSAGALWRDVALGSILSFSENLTAPTVPGTYSYGFIMQHDGHDFGPEFAIKVIVQDEPAAKDDAGPDGACHQYEVEPGATYQMTYTIRNTGASTWTPADYVFLLVDARGQPPAESAYRLTGNVPPGGTYTFTKTLQAPQQPGEYRYNYFMRHGDKRFGFSCNTTVTVAQQTDPSPTPPGGKERKTPEPKRLRFESKSSERGVPNWPVSELNIAGYDEKRTYTEWAMPKCDVGLVSACRDVVDVPDKWWTGDTALSFTLHPRVSAHEHDIQDRCAVDLDQIEFSWWRRFWDRLWGKTLLVTVTYDTTAKQCSTDPPVKTAGN